MPFPTCRGEEASPPNRILQTSRSIKSDAIQNALARVMFVAMFARAPAACVCVRACAFQRPAGLMPPRHGQRQASKEQAVEQNFKNISAKIMQTMQRHHRLHTIAEPQCCKGARVVQQQ